MTQLDNLANFSNEQFEQNVMRLRQAFRQQKVVTVQAASRYFGFTPMTIRKWCRYGSIPLLDPTGPQSPVVPMNAQNRPPWLVL